MTCREKIAMEHPGRLDNECLGGCAGCPHTYGYAQKPEWCKPTEEICRKCWDGEVEEVETQADAEVKTEVGTDVDSGIKSNGEMTVFAIGAVRDKKPENVAATCFLRACYYGLLNTMVRMTMRRKLVVNVGNSLIVR